MTVPAGGTVSRLAFPELPAIRLFASWPQKWGHNCFEPAVKTSELGETVGRPLFRTDTVVDKEKAFGIVLPFDLSEAPVVRAPI
jgi:hypothetical protein